jgi:hypothetical protein
VQALQVGRIARADTANAIDDPHQLTGAALKRARRQMPTASRRCGAPTIFASNSFMASISGPVRHDLLQTGIFPFQVPETLGLVDLQAPIFIAPAVEGLLGDAVMARQGPNLLTALLSFLENLDNLLFTELPFLHVRIPFSKWEF